MSEKRPFVLSLIGIVMVSASVCSVFAKAPDTPKIIFGTHRGRRKSGTLPHEPRWQ